MLRVYYQNPNNGIPNIPKTSNTPNTPNTPSLFAFNYIKNNISKKDNTILEHIEISINKFIQYKNTNTNANTNANANTNYKYKINNKISLVTRIILQQYDIEPICITKLCGLKHYTVLKYDKFWNSHMIIFSKPIAMQICYKNTEQDLTLPISIPIPIPISIITDENTRLLEERKNYKDYRDKFNKIQCGYKSRYCK